MTFTLYGICPLLQVFDGPASLRFYREVLGFTVIERAGEGDRAGWALLGLRGAEFMLNTAHEEGGRPPSLTGYGFRAVTVHDPDGYALCFHWPATQAGYDRWVERYGLPPRTVEQSPSGDAAARPREERA